MAIAFAQSVTGNTTTGTTAGTFTNPTVSGNLLVVTTSDDSGTTSNGVSVSDNKGNTFTKKIHQGSASTLSMWYAWNIAGGSGHQITVAWSTAATGRMTFAAQEFSGLATATDPFDQSASAGGTSNAPSVNSPATTFASELVVGGVSAAWSTAGTVSLGSGFTNLGTVSVANCGVGQESKVVSSTGIQAVTFGLSASTTWLAGVLTFTAPVVAPAYPYVPISQYASFH